MGFEVHGGLGPDYGLGGPEPGEDYHNVSVYAVDREVVPDYPALEQLVRENAGSVPVIEFQATVQSLDDLTVRSFKRVNIVLARQVDKLSIRLEVAEQRTIG